jgi:CheY-like chemotaxis protein
MRKALILVVDDNAKYREWLAWILERYGFETISGKSGWEAVELAIICLSGCFSKHQDVVVSP